MGNLEDAVINELTREYTHKALLAVMFAQVRYPMRYTDYMICERIASYGGIKPTKREWLKVCAEYVWDHICRGPEDFTPEDILDTTIKALEDNS